jgi:peptidylamidoglycolate lyase
VKPISILMALVVVFGATGSIVAQEGGADTSSPYDLVSGWLKPVAKERIIHPVTVFAESENRVLIGIDRMGPVTGPGQHEKRRELDLKVPSAKVDHQVFVVDQEGKIVEDWSKWAHRFGKVNKITMNPYDSDKHIWIIDGATQQAMEFSHDGKDLVFTVGEKGVAGSDDKHFDGPADVCWLPDGTFFVADGFGNNRIVKFDKNGRYLKEWGRKGSAPGEFNHPQSIAVDARRHVWVADRGNSRIQIFDENGKFLDQWKDFKEPQKVEITQDDAVWVWDAATERFADYDMKGKLSAYWVPKGSPDSGAEKPKDKTSAEELAWQGDFSVDPEGNLYLVNQRSGTIDKFVPKKDANKNRLVGQPYFLDVAITTY